MNSKEIAKLAGVSRSTVSRVINNYSNVPEETKRKVQEVIKKYNYVPHESARVLAGGKNRRLGLFIVDSNPDLLGRQVSMSYYFSTFSSVVIDTSNKMGYTVVISLINSEKDFERIEQLFIEKTIDGGIFIGVRGNEEEIRNLISSGYKIVLVDQDVNACKEIYKKCTIINANNNEGAYMATKYLIDLGHENIAHVTGGKTQFSTVERLKGYRRALETGGLVYQENLIYQGNFTVNSGYSATKKLLSNNKVSAIFYSNDSMALGGIQAVEEMGLKIPDDVSIVGFDDVEIAQYLKPGLTTVKMDLFKMASVAIEALINAMEQEESVSGEYTIPVDLIIRGTCKKL